MAIVAIRNNYDQTQNNQVSSSTVLHLLRVLDTSQHIPNKYEGRAHISTWKTLTLVETLYLPQTKVEPISPHGIYEYSGNK